MTAKSRPTGKTIHVDRIISVGRDRETCGAVIRLKDADGRTITLWLWKRQLRTLARGTSGLVGAGGGGVGAALRPYRLRPPTTATNICHEPFSSLRRDGMPVSYRIDPAQKIVYTTFEAEVTDQQFLRHAREIASDPEIDGSFVELIHGRTSSMRGVTHSGVQKAVDALRASTPIRKIGIVASRDVDFGLARMIQLRADESLIEIQVFREQAEARCWLGIG